MADAQYLTPAELKNLTGYETRPAVTRWLERNNWPYASASKDGWPRVLRDYHDARLSGRPPGKRDTLYEPNWGTAA